MTIHRTLLAAALTIAAAPAFAATVTDTATSVTLWNGDLIADAFAPVSDAGDFSYAFISGTTDFVLSLGNGTDEVLYGEADGWTFDGSTLISFVFRATGAATALFGESVLVTLRLDEAVANPFAADIDTVLNATMTIGAQETPAPVPLPATLPLLAGAVLGAGALLRRRKR